MSGSDLSFGGFDTKAAAAQIGKSFLEELQHGREQKLLKQVDDIKKMAEEFEKLAEDPVLDDQDRVYAANHARSLRLLQFGKPLPKEYQPDPKAKDPEGKPIRLPSAMLPLLYKKALKQGPGTPAQPASIGQPPAPSAPGASALPPMPQLDAGGPPKPGLTMGAEPTPPELGAPPQPGGDHFAANAISPAPAIKGMPPAPGAPAVAAAPGAPGMLPQPPAPAFDEFTWQPKFRSAEEIAAESAKLKGIENTITLNGQQVDARALPAMGRQQTASIQMRKIGLNPDGSAIPLEQLTPKERAELTYRQSQMELADARIELAEAQAAGIPANIQIALGRLAIAQQNANTASQRAAIDSAIYGSMLGGMNGGPPGLLGSPDMGISDPLEAMTEQVLTNQIEMTAIPSKLRPLVSLKIAQRGGVIVPEKLQSKLMHFTEAREAVDTIYDSLERYIKSEGTDALWSGYQYKSKVDALTRIIGRSLGEKGVFTDADKADFTKLLSPGVILSLTNPQRAQSWVKEVEGIMNRVEADQLQGFYQRVYAKKDGTLSTLAPGSQKNVVAELGGDTKPKPAASTAAPLPPISERVANKTRARINGQDMIWTGKGWKPVK